MTDDWSKTWAARENALTAILGPTADTVLHAVVPFHLGGQADVLQFPHFVPGMTYVTADLTADSSGQRPSTLGNYELMICTRTPLQAADSLISMLARYTCEAELNPLETMDLPNFFQDDAIRGVLFAHPGDNPLNFAVEGRQYGLLLLIGITLEELTFKQKYGSAKLLALLKSADVFPYTTPNRPTIPLPRPSIFGRLFGG